MLQVTTPAIPYEGYFDGAVEPGFNLVVAGQAYLGSSRFSINLCCGKTIPGYPQPEIALHLNVRFDQLCIARNTLISNVWGQEERSNGFPLLAGTPFQFMIKAEAHQFDIFVNGNYFASFKYRIPLNRIATLRIHGEVIVQHAIATSVAGKVHGQTSFPLKPTSPELAPPLPPPYTEHGGAEVSVAWPPMAPSLSYAPTANAPPIPPPRYTPPVFVPVATLVPVPCLPSPLPPVSRASLFDIDNPIVPVFAHIPGKLRPGLNFEIIATPKVNCQRMEINFKCPNDDIALRVNPRFTSNQLVRNCRRYGSWGADEHTVPYFPFVRGQSFHLLITCHTDAFQVNVNSRDILTFRHRYFPINSVTLMEVTGDLDVHRINITDT